MVLASADQWLGLAVSRVLCKRSFHCPEDVAEVCMEELEPLTKTTDESVVATAVEGERDWGTWLAQCGSSMGGAFMSRHGLWAPHSLSFKLRQDLLAHERAQVEEEVG